MTFPNIHLDGNFTCVQKIWICPGGFWEKSCLKLCSSVKTSQAHILPILYCDVYIFWTVQHYQLTLFLLKIFWFDYSSQKLFFLYDETK